MANKLVRETAKARGIKLWQIAERIPLADSNFSRHLRRELPDEERERILGIIEQLASEGEVVE